MKSWFGRVPAETLQNEPEQYFGSIDLKKIDQLHAQCEILEVKASGSPELARNSVLVKQGDVYAGQFISMDPRTGQPTSIAAKVYIEQVLEPTK